MRFARLSFFVIAALHVTAAPALASDNGEGLAGETDDPMVTLFSLGVMIFFVLFVVITSILQARKERRKEAESAESMRQRIGW